MPQTGSVVPSVRVDVFKAYLYHDYVGLVRLAGRGELATLKFATGWAAVAGAGSAQSD